ncbi:MAG: neuraminidase (sialidase)-like protein [Opitutus sp.]|nr:neuraminidase (sialidase)-like protein [Opitutus sp.]
MSPPLRFLIAGFLLISGLLRPLAPAAPAEKSFHTSELIFPLEHWHNHGSCIVEAPNGDLIVCWFHGSGERTADDVKIEGARLRRGQRTWSPRFTMADTPGYPDTNCCLFFDPQDRLWLLWPTILANTWESALMKYRISTNYLPDGPPKWDVNEVMHVTPGPEFEPAVVKFVQQAEAALNASTPAVAGSESYGRKWLASLRTQAADKLTRRLGWFTRAHPFVLDGRRLIVPLYSDGFDFSLMAISDDWGQTWHTSTPLIGRGNIQPSIVRRQDGSLYSLMRDNGPPPKRLHQSESRDRGETWSVVTDTDLPNPGSGAEITGLRNGHWILIGNDTESGRHSLAVQISDDEGKTWKWKRHLELTPDVPGQGSSARNSARYHYPSIIQAKDGTLHASYSYQAAEHGAEKDAEGKSRIKAIKHAHFNEAWVMSGDPK